MRPRPSHFYAAVFNREGAGIRAYFPPSKTLSIEQAEPAILSVWGNPQCNAHYQGAAKNMH